MMGEKQGQSKRFPLKRVLVWNGAGDNMTWDAPDNWADCSVPGPGDRVSAPKTIFATMPESVKVGFAEYVRLWETADEPR